MGRIPQHASAGRSSLQRASSGHHTVDALTRGESHDLYLQSSTS